MMCVWFSHKLLKIFLWMESTAASALIHFLDIALTITYLSFSACQSASCELLRCPVQVVLSRCDNLAIHFVAGVTLQCRQEVLCSTSKNQCQELRSITFARSELSWLVDFIPQRQKLMMSSMWIAVLIFSFAMPVSPQPLFPGTSGVSVR